MRCLCLCGFSMSNVNGNLKSSLDSIQFNWCVILCQFVFVFVCVCLCVCVHSRYRDVLYLALWMYPMYSRRQFCSFPFCPNFFFVLHVLRFMLMGCEHWKQFSHELFVYTHLYPRLRSIYPVSTGDFGGERNRSSSSSLIWRITLTTVSDSRINSKHSMINANLINRNSFHMIAIIHVNVVHIVVVVVVVRFDSFMHWSSFCSFSWSSMLWLVESLDK